jgi:hypothetical protein
MHPKKPVLSHRYLASSQIEQFELHPRHDGFRRYDLGIQVFLDSGLYRNDITALE